MTLAQTGALPGDTPTREREGVCRRAMSCHPPPGNARQRARPRGQRREDARARGTSARRDRPATARHLPVAARRQEPTETRALPRRAALRPQPRPGANRCRARRFLHAQRALTVRHKTCDVSHASDRRSGGRCSAGRPMPPRPLLLPRSELRRNRSGNDCNQDESWLREAPAGIISRCLRSTTSRAAFGCFATGS